MAEVTRLLQRIHSGDPNAQEELVQHVYMEIRRLAKAHMHRERVGHSWDPTDLVHEAMPRLFSIKQLRSLDNRAQFLKAAWRAFHHELISHERKRSAGIRGGGQIREPLEVVLDHHGTQGEDPAARMDLEEGLTRLRDRYPRQIEALLLHVFNPLKQAEVAGLLGVSQVTVERHIRFIRARLRQFLEGGGR